MFVDIHTHNKSESDNPSIRNLTFSEAEQIFNSGEKGLFSVGFHPWYAENFSEKSFQLLEKWATEGKLIAIGECGLDKTSQFDLNFQIEIFKKQISLSEKTQLPVIIHCVGFFNELLELKKQLNPQQLWIIHGFRGKPELAKQILKAGFSISFGERFNIESVSLTPIDKLFVETDESQLSIKEIYIQIADIKNINPGELTAGELFFQKITSKISKHKT